MGAAATVLAMLHDVVLLVGVFAWLGRPVDGVFLAALLTVIGYSVNDTVVVFDRIRELVRASPRGARSPELANPGCLQTVPRTVNTGLGAVFVLVALAVLGRDSLVDFAVALLIGIVVGTYSSVFLAAPLAIVFESRPGGLVGKLAVRASVKTPSGRAQQRRRAPREPLPPHLERAEMDIERVNLPGIGMRHAFTTERGRRIGVVSHHTGRRDLVVYDADDPDTAVVSVALTGDGGRTRWPNCSAPPASSSASPT